MSCEKNITINYCANMDDKLVFNVDFEIPSNWFSRSKDTNTLSISTDHAHNIINAMLTELNKVK